MRFTSNAQFPGPKIGNAWEPPIMQRVARGPRTMVAVEAIREAR